MNLKKLFETQKVLRDRIGYNEPDRFEKLILALLVEIGECANEWRGFKFWSKDQEPRLRKERKQLKEGLELFDNYECAYEWVPYNPLLEEHVDLLHFLLEIGLELNYIDFEIWTIKEKTISLQFIEVFNRISNLLFQMRVTGKVTIECYEYAWSTYIGLGEMLGFTWEQIEEAYYAKNQINHERQSNGY